MELTYPEELLLGGIDQFLHYGRRNAFSYSAGCTLDDSTATMFHNYVFPRDSQAGRYMAELTSLERDPVAGAVEWTEVSTVYSFLTVPFFSSLCGKLAAMDHCIVHMAAVSGIHLLYTDKTVVVFQLESRALLDVAGTYMALGGARLN